MARDFDIRRPQRSHIAPEHKATKRSRNMSAPLSFMIIIGMAVLGYGAYSAISTKPSANTTPQISSTQTAVPAEVQTTGITPITNAKAIVKVYNSGGGDKATTDIVGQLQAAKYQVENEGASQFDYDKTYIWYSTGKDSVAKNIATLLKDRDTILKESKLEGIFDIIVYIGKT